MKRSDCARNFKHCITANSGLVLLAMDGATIRFPKPITLAAVQAARIALR
jgi:hypothetical protein